jgi:hypothetical protein
MYERVTMKCGDAEHRIILSQADKSLLSLIGERISADGLRVLQNIFLRSFRNRAAALRHFDLVNALGEALRALEQEGESLSFMYSFTVKDGPLASTGSGAVSGIRMPDDESSYYSLRAGLGVCKLERCGIDEHGIGFVIEAIDCRDRTKLATENCGAIAIKRRKLNLAFPSRLKELHAKLIKEDCDELQLSYEETRSVPKESAL